jgi:hypothetical protein
VRLIPSLSTGAARLEQLLFEMRQLLLTPQELRSQVPALSKTAIHRIRARLHRPPERRVKGSLWRAEKIRRRLSIDSTHNAARRGGESGFG